MLSSYARAVIGDTHPVVFAAAQLGFGSVVEFLKEAGKGKVSAELINSYAKAVDEKGVIPFFAVKPIEDACVKVNDEQGLERQRAMSAQLPERPPDKSKRKRRKQSERRYSVGRRRH